MIDFCSFVFFYTSFHFYTSACAIKSPNYEWVSYSMQSFSTTTISEAVCRDLDAELKRTGFFFSFKRTKNTLKNGKTPGADSSLWVNDTKTPFSHLVYAEYTCSPCGFLKWRPGRSCTGCWKRSGLDQMAEYIWSASQIYLRRIHIMD